MSDSKKLHIILVDNYLSLKRAGIPALSSCLANFLVKRGHRVTIYTQRTLFVKSLYPLHDRVELRTYKFTDNNRKIQKFRNEIRALDPDVCAVLLPDGQHLVWAVTLLGTGVPFVYSEHHSPATIENEFWSRKGRLAAMSGADRIHLLLPSFAKSIPDFLQGIVRVIPNPAPDIEEHANVHGIGGSRKKILWLGRFQEELKQCCLALDAFAMLASKHVDWDLHIVGTGQDKALIHSHAKRLKLAERIVFHGNTNNVFPHYLSAQIFCISSRTEGQPIALLEAQACGLPAVGFSSCEGVSELILHEKNGLLAGDMNATSLAEQLNRLMSDDILRCQMGEQAKKDCIRYPQTGCMEAWEKLLMEAAACKGNTVMDSFQEEPFASLARLSSATRREWLWRDFGNPMPYSVEGYILWAYLAIRHWWPGKTK